jgi:hypothetical protein
VHHRPVTNNEPDRLAVASAICDGLVSGSVIKVSRTVGVGLTCAFNVRYTYIASGDARRTLPLLGTGIEQLRLWIRLRLRL